MFSNLCFQFDKLLKILSFGKEYLQIVSTLYQTKEFGLDKIESVGSKIYVAQR